LADHAIPKTTSTTFHQNTSLAKKPTYSTGPVVSRYVREIGRVNEMTQPADVGRGNRVFSDFGRD
jgi:hypothetical protein